MEPLDPADRKGRKATPEQQAQKDNQEKPAHLVL